MKEKILFTWSGGKDSSMALYSIIKEGKYDIASLITTVTEDYDRISMHGVRRELLMRQAESMGLNLDIVYIPKDSSNDTYEHRMADVLSKYKEQGITKVAFGDIFLQDIREYRQKNLDKIGMRALFPLWKKDTLKLYRDFIRAGFCAVITCIDTRVLDESFAGRILDADFSDEIPENTDPCGENGEFHTFVFDGPIFKNKINCYPAEKVLRGSFLFCDVIAV